MGLQTFVKPWGDSLLEDRKEALPLLPFSVKNNFDFQLPMDVGRLVSLVESETGVNSQWTIKRMHHEIDLAQGLEHTTRGRRRVLRLEALADPRRPDARATRRHADAGLLMRIDPHDWKAIEQLANSRDGTARALGVARAEYLEKRGALYAEQPRRTTSC
jgi:hypothetical protein